LTRQLCAGLPPERIGWAAPDWSPAHIADLPAGLVAADLLLADTGTCMVACRTPHERLMCYLPPVSIVVANVDRLFEHLPAAWEEIARRAADPGLRGEFVFITGPSRTSDIEKILILGVHGPKRLVVLLVG
jgi:L-lactate dehydrogenase complex protein LldG